MPNLRKFQEDTFKVPDLFQEQVMKVRTDKMNKAQKSNTSNMSGKQSSTAHNIEQSFDFNKTLQQKPGTAGGHHPANQSFDTKRVQSQQVSTRDADRVYKIQRFCNTVKVYKEFCQLTGTKPKWSNYDEKARTEVAMASQLDDSVHPVKKKVATMDFAKQSKRRDICDGEYSANEGRFLRNPVSSFQTSHHRINIAKYSNRDSRSTGPDNFEVSLSGLFYETQDNFSANLSSAHTFVSEKVWRSQREKKKYAKYKLTKDDLRKIDFRKVEQKQKSVNPKRGRAQRRLMNREDDDLFMKFILQPQLKRQNLVD